MHRRAAVTFREHYERSVQASRRGGDARRAARVGAAAARASRSRRRQHLCVGRVDRRRRTHATGPRAHRRPRRAAVRRVQLGARASRVRAQVSSAGRRRSAAVGELVVAAHSGSAGPSADGAPAVGAQSVGQHCVRSGGSGCAFSSSRQPLVAY